MILIDPLEQERREKQMSEATKTYRKDLYYVNMWQPVEGPTDAGKMIMGRREFVCYPILWWLYRIQFWRFAKMINFNVLREMD